MKTVVEKTWPADLDLDPPMGMLICDPPPARITMLFIKEQFSEEDADRLRLTWDDAMRTGKVVVLPDYVTPVFAGSPGWPDWEFCAA